MSLRSSIHIFTEKPEKVVKYITGKIRSDQEELSVIENYFSRVRRACADVDVDAVPLHNRERFFAKKMFSLYPTYVPSFIIKQDFIKHGIPLNINGDIVVLPWGVSCISSRYFSCGDSLEGMVFHTVKGFSKELRSRVIAYSLCVDEKTTPECRVYFADFDKICYIRRSENPDRNITVGDHLLFAMWPDIEWPAIIAETDVTSFSNLIETALNIPVSEDLSAFEYQKTERLYSIFSAPTHTTNLR